MIEKNSDYFLKDDHEKDGSSDNEDALLMRMLEDLLETIRPYEKEIDRLEKEYGFDRPDHQLQCLMIPLSDLKKLRARLHVIRMHSKKSPSKD